MDALLPDHFSAVIKGLCTPGIRIFGNFVRAMLRAIEMDEFNRRSILQFVIVEAVVHAISKNRRSGLLHDRASSRAGLQLSWLATTFGLVFVDVQLDRWIDREGYA
jgi:hypothetical protein